MYGVERCFPQNAQPNPEQIAAFAGTPLWENCAPGWKRNGSARPLVQYSSCSGAKGWNVKYRKGGRALCTLYPGLPGGGSFTCLIAMDPKQATWRPKHTWGRMRSRPDAYRAAPLLNGARWLMLDVKNRQVLRDVQALLRIRAGAR